MKKFSYLVVLLIALFVFPFGVLAEEGGRLQEGLKSVKKKNHPES